jgi:hypothetical protein
MELYICCHHVLPLILSKNKQYYQVVDMTIPYKLDFSSALLFFLKAPHYPFDQHEMYSHLYRNHQISGQSAL